ncbi:MFS transporter [Cohnella sp. AR92]|uniref:MFS transporter n=1 Tax=Cohnella sp. AR92 TaxID=648716 RepID=UPI001315994B|nr:MFS transporter [Cohnella sp. AR92]
MEKLKAHSNSRMTGTVWMMIAFLFVLTVISNTDKAVIGFASVKIMDELGLNATQWGLVGSVFFWLYAVSAVLMGIFSDKMGTKLAITIMALVWAAVQFSTLFVHSFAFLLITRLILGAGEGPSYSLAMTTAAKWLPRGKLGFGLTLVSIGGPLGVAMSAPPLIQLISSHGWRSAFLATGIIGVVWVVLWLLFAKDRPASPDNLSSAAVEARHPAEDSKFLKIVFSRSFLLVALCGFATYWSYTVGLVWLPNYFAKVRHLSAAELKVAVTLPWIMITISQLLFSTISDWLYRRTKSMFRSRVSILSPVLIGAGISYALGTIVNSNPLTVALLSLGLTFGCITLVIGPAILVELVPPKHQGKAQGIFMAASSLGGIVAPYVTGKLVQGSADQAAGFNGAFQLIAVILCVVGALAWLLVRSPRIAKPSTEAREPEGKLETGVS